MAPKQKSVPS